MIYLNFVYNNTIETVDQLDPNNFNSYKEFRKERERLIFEYRLSGMNVYPSQRSTKEWRES